MEANGSKYNDNVNVKIDKNDDQKTQKIRTKTRINFIV